MKKKPIYKKIWFWIIVIAVAGGVAASTGKKKEKAKAEAKTYSVGDTVNVKDTEFTLKGVELTPQRNQFEKKQPAQVVKISYSVKNNSDKDLTVGLGMVEVYGPDKKKSESYANENTIDTVAPGMEKDCVAHYGLNEAGDIQINFSKLFSGGKAIFKAHV